MKRIDPRLLGLVCLFIATGILIAKTSVIGRPPQRTPNQLDDGAPNINTEAPPSPNNSSFPLRDNNPYDFLYRGAFCVQQTGGYEVCTAPTLPPSRFQFVNHGPNDIVPAPTSTYRERNWVFYLNGYSRQDLYLQIEDTIDDLNSHIQESYIYFFPREVTPSIKVESNRLIVTLPTKEVVVYDLQTKKVLEGVLKEDGPVGPHSANVSYVGAGVMVRVDAKGKEPRLGTIAKIYQPNKPICKVPARSLWLDQRSDSAFHFRFFNDQDFFNFINKNCQ